MPGSHSRVVPFFSAFKISHSSLWVIVEFTTGWMIKATDIVKRLISHTEDESDVSCCIYGMNDDENSLLTFLTVSYRTLTLKKWRNQFKVSVKKKLSVSWSHHVDTMTLKYILWFGSIAGLAENWMRCACDWAQWSLCFNVNGVIVVCVLFVLEDYFCVGCVQYHLIQKSGTTFKMWDTKSNLNQGKLTKLYLRDDS